MLRAVNKQCKCRSWGEKEEERQKGTGQPASKMQMLATVFTQVRD